MENRGFGLERWPYVDSHNVPMDNKGLAKYVQGPTEIWENFLLRWYEK